MVSMKTYQRNVIDGYIVSVVKGTSACNMTEEEYAAFRAALAQRPVTESGYGCRMKADLSWELYELPPSPAVTAEE